MATMAHGSIGAFDSSEEGWETYEERGGSTPHRRDRGSCQNCYRCGSNHKATSCRHKETTCHHCGEKGRVRRVCKKKQNIPERQKFPEDGESNVYNMFPLRSKIYDPIGITLTVNGEPLRMEVDTGATLSVISEVTYRQTRETNGLLSVGPKLG